MIFPKVQEFEFRVSSSSPVEVAAKILAIQNGHKEEWQRYSFSYCKEAKHLNEVQVSDLKRAFGHLKEKVQQSKITLFYKIKDLADVLRRQAQEQRQAAQLA